MNTQDWSDLIGRDVCITTAGETVCGVVTEIVHGERADGRPEAVFDWGMAIALDETSTVQPSEPHKRCTACGRHLPRSAFHKNGPYRAGRCKECTSARRRAAHAANPAAQREANRRYRKSHPEQNGRWARTHRAQYLAYQRAYYHTHLKEKRRTGGGS